MRGKQLTNVTQLVSIGIGIYFAGWLTSHLIIMLRETFHLWEHAKSKMKMMSNDTVHNNKEEQS